MLKFAKGEKYIKKQDKKVCSIIDIKINDNIIVHVFPGDISPNDILIKYKEGNKRIRTPKHIHWLVNLLIKKEYNPQLLNQMLDLFVLRWNEVTPLTYRDFNSIKNSLYI